MDCYYAQFACSVRPGLIAVDPTTFKVIVAPSLKKTAYGDLEDKVLNLPLEPSLRRLACRRVRRPSRSRGGFGRPKQCGGHRGRRRGFFRDGRTQSPACRGS